VEAYTVVVDDAILSELSCWFCPIILDQVQERLCLRCSYRIKDTVAHMNLDHASNENLNEIGPERHWNPMKEIHESYWSVSS
jgi:hypothetical protein